MRELIRNIIREYHQVTENRVGGRRAMTKSDFIKKSQEKYHDEEGNPLYTYNNLEFKNVRTPVNITCPKHGDFSVLASNHLSGRSGCPKCKFEMLNKINTSTEDEFINKGNQIHNNKFKYDKVVYVNNRVPVIITCPKHGDFEQVPRDHLSGNGCPICLESKGENFIGEILTKNEIDFERQKEFQDCTNKISGRYCRKLPFDFYIPKKNTLIEFDGRQHFLPIWGQDSLNAVTKNDELKNDYCEKKGIKLIRIPYTMSPEEIETYLLMELGITD